VAELETVVVRLRLPSNHATSNHVKDLGLNASGVNGATGVNAASLVGVEEFGGDTDFLRIQPRQVRRSAVERTKKNRRVLSTPVPLKK